ncbi:Rho GTPase [Paraconiothyrium brasiliense]|uniref:Rho GTPase n=1 Tax=Paraconiothyrium brasiliense TaxID=300254 RepID=A0ABR3QKG7_9PLEO
MPLVFKEYVTECSVDGQSIDVALWDTTGQEDYDQLRANSYSGTQVVIICFLVNAEQPNHEQVRNKWILEANERCPGAGRIIVGVEPDGSYQTSRIDIVRGKRLAVEAARATIASADADDSRIWRLPFRDVRQRLSIINENGVTGPSRSEDESSSPGFIQKRRRKRSGLKHTSPPAIVQPTMKFCDFEDSEDASGHVNGNYPMRLFVTNGDNSVVL